MRGMVFSVLEIPTLSPPARSELPRAREPVQRPVRNPQVPRCLFGIEPHGLDFSGSTRHEVTPKQKRHGEPNLFGLPVASYQPWCVSCPTCYKLREQNSKDLTEW
jgi:hypothetical protein